MKVSPGQTNYFLASKEKGLLTLDWRILMERLKRRDIQAMYMREYYLYSELSPQRIHYLEERLIPSSERRVKINYDFRPISYYYNMVLWSTYFKYNLKKLFRAMSPRKIYASLAILYMIMLTPILLRRLRSRAPRIGLLTAVATTGFAEVTFQIVTLLSFQILYGYVFYKLGIILTSYMLGLIFGGWLVTRMIERNRGDEHLFRKTQVLIVIYPMLLPLLFWMFATLKSEVSFNLGSNIVFPFLPIIPGLIGGFQFPLANKLYLKGREGRVAKSAGLTYGLDLFGSCLGALVASLILIPILGIYITCIVVALLNMVSLILLSVRLPYAAIKR